LAKTSDSSSGDSVPPSLIGPANLRALEMRGNEYILPIHMEDIAIPGIPPTLVYLPGDLGVEQIAEIFMAKLAYAN
jgi:hypothetical protein